MEQEWIHTALQKIKDEYNIEGKWTLQEEPGGVDGKLTFTINHQVITYYAEVKNEVRNHQMDHILRLEARYKPLIVIARRIFPKLKDLLRTEEIAYLEGNGNIYLRQGKTMVLIDANKPLEIKKEINHKAFTKTGLKLIFEILRNQNFINLTYRGMAEKAKIALGNVNNIINELKDDGYLILMNKDEWKLMKKKELLEKWMAAYLEKLKPTLAAGKFRFLNTIDFQNWQKIPVDPKKTRWGGEPAGDYLTHYLKPAILTMYTTERREDLIKKYRLIPDENGKVEIFEKFWEEDNLYPAIAPTILVYADLINTADPRCIETAKKIYDEQLANEF